MFERLVRHLLDESQRCVRPPVDRFRHPWLSPMPLSAESAQELAHRRGISPPPPAVDRGDGFQAGDYSLGLFHHDASEAAIELLRHDGTRDGAAGALLCLLDCGDADGRVFRALLPHKARETEPSKPVIAQYAHRVAVAMGPEFSRRARLYERAAAFIGYLEREYTGMHGLPVTHSALQSGFDSDLLTAGLPDRSVEGPDTATFMVLEYRALAALASMAGEKPDRWLERASNLSELLDTLCYREDDRGGFYAALRWQRGAGNLHTETVSHPRRDGSNEPLESWTSLLPLYAQIPSKERAEKIIKRLTDPELYWGPHGVRTLPATSLYFQQAPRVMQFDFKKHDRGPVSNWSGPVWILSNYYLAEALGHYGKAPLAKELALRTANLLANGLERDGGLRECYDDAGRGLWPKAGTFLSWNVLALTLLRNHVPGAGVP